MNDAHWGLIYDSELPAGLKIGDLLAGYVRRIRPDGKLDLALGQAGYRRIGPLTDQIIAILQAKGGRLPYHDNSLPEEIREVFGMSKKLLSRPSVYSSVSGGFISNLMVFG